MLATSKNISKMKEISKKLNRSFSSVLKGYVREEAIRLIFQSRYKDVLWMKNGVLLQNSNIDDGIELYYIEEEKKIKEDFYPGQKLTQELANYMVSDIFGKKQSDEVLWKIESVQKDFAYYWNLTAVIDEMFIPMHVKIASFHGKHPNYEKESFTSDITNKQISYLCFSWENCIAENLYQIMNKLELIDSMEPYANVDKILQKQTISGRRVMEELKCLTQQESKILSYRRMEQIRYYENYTYMRKRWERYEKSCSMNLCDWTEVLHRFIKFADPIWQKLCQNEVFVEDWMPELERFLG